MRKLGIVKDSSGHVAGAEEARWRRGSGESGLHSVSKAMVKSLDLEKKKKKSLYLPL